MWKKTSRIGVVVFLALILVIGSVLGACAPSPAEPPPAEKPPTEKPPAEKPPVEKVVKVGDLTDLTGLGASTIGMIFHGIGDYIKYINEKGGIEGVKLERVWVDTGYKLPPAISAYDKWRDEVVAIITNISTQNEALRPKWKKDRMPVVSNAVTVPAMYPPGPIFFARPDYASQFGWFVDWLVDEYWKESRPPRVAFVTYDNPFGKGPLPAIAYAEKRGVEIVEKAFIPGLPSDTTAELMRCKKAEADFIFMNTVEPPAAVVLKDAYRLGLSVAAGGPMTVVLCMQGCPQMMLKLAGVEACEGYLNLSVMATMEETDVPGIKLGHDIQQKYYGEMKYPFDTYFWALPQTAIAVEGIRLALKEVGYENLDSDAVWKALEKAKDIDMMGISPPVSFTPTERRGNMSLRLVTIEGGKMKEVSSWKECPDLLLEAAKEAGLVK